MKITRIKLRQIIKEEIQKEYYGSQSMPSHQPGYGVGNLTFEDVKELFPNLSKDEQNHIWREHKHLNNIGELKAAILGL